LLAEEDERQALLAEDRDRGRGEIAEWLHGDESDFQPVMVPETISETGTQTTGSDPSPAHRAAAIHNFAGSDTEESFQRITEAFDDSAPDVRSAAAQALYDLQEDHATTFTRALRDAPADRRVRIGAAIAASGLADQAISNLTGASRDKTYDAFSLLFLMSKSGELNPLMRAIEEHPSTEVRVAVVKLLALSGQPEVLPAFRRMAVRGSLPPDVRAAVMEAIYQVTSQSPESDQPLP
jgi:HEAT repeat protein